MEQTKKCHNCDKDATKGYDDHVRVGKGLKKIRLCDQCYESQPKFEKADNRKAPY